MMKPDARKRRKQAWQKLLVHMQREAEEASKKPNRKSNAEPEEGGQPEGLASYDDFGWTKTTKPRGPQPLSEFSMLPEKIQNEARDLFVEGGTFEDIAEYVRELQALPGSEGEAPQTTPRGISLPAIQRYFRADLKLQTRRIKRLQEKGQALKRALAGDPNSAEAELADAVFFTGLMGMDRAGVHLQFREAKQAFASRQSLRLRQDSFKLKTLDSEAARKNVEARTATN